MVIWQLSTIKRPFRRIYGTPDCFLRSSGQSAEVCAPDAVRADASHQLPDDRSQRMPTHDPSELLLVESHRGVLGHCGTGRNHGVPAEHEGGVTHVHRGKGHECPAGSPMIRSDGDIVLRRGHIRRNATKKPRQENLTANRHFAMLSVQQRKSKLQTMITSKTATSSAAIRMESNCQGGRKCRVPLSDGRFGAGDGIGVSSRRSHSTSFFESISQLQNVTTSDDHNTGLSRDFDCQQMGLLALTQ